MTQIQRSPQMLFENKIDDQIIECIDNYSKPNTLSEKIGWVAYCVFNALKSIFGRSDWQIVCKEEVQSEVADLKQEGLWPLEALKPLSYKGFSWFLEYEINRSALLKSASEEDFETVKRRVSDSFWSIDRYEMKRCLNGYTSPYTFFEKVKWVAYRAFNALKSLFGRSDWQNANNRVMRLMSQNGCIRGLNELQRAILPKVVELQLCDLLRSEYQSREIGKIIEKLQELGL